MIPDKICVEINNTVKQMELMDFYFEYNLLIIIYIHQYSFDKFDLLPLYYKDSELIETSDSKIIIENYFNSFY